MVFVQATLVRPHCSVIDHWKSAIENKQINLAFFVDFKKAFDLVNHDLLVLKLFHYGFDNNSLALIRNYFQNRSQVTKIDSYFSSPANILLRAPQGREAKYSVLFADDTTLSESNSSVEPLISSYKSKLEPMLNWCNANQMFINWRKTKFMFIHNKKNAFMPNSIAIGNDEIEVVQSFKLLGIIIDASLLFTDCIKAMKKSINIKLYSFKKLFFLSKSVKSHFFKAFIQPLFVYCSALAVYLNKTQLKNMEKFQKVALFRLLNVKLFGLDHLTQKATLDKYKLMPYLMRLCLRLSTLCHKVTNKLLLISFSNNFSNKFSKKTAVVYLIAKITAKEAKKSYHCLIFVQILVIVHLLISCQNL